MYNAAFNVTAFKFVKKMFVSLKCSQNGYDFKTFDISHSLVIKKTVDVLK